MNFILELTKGHNKLVMILVLCILSDNALYVEQVRYPIRSHTFVSPSADSKRAVVRYWRKYVHEVLVNRLGCLSQPRKTLAVPT